eukprot:13858634-Alexandrium_andersonii.AAC.1
MCIRDRGQERGPTGSTSASDGILERPARITRASVTGTSCLHVPGPEGRARAKGRVHSSRRGH